MKKAMVWILAAVMGLTILGGCGKEKETPAPEPEKTQEEAAADPHQGQARSYFTGEWIDEDLAKVRPFAVMLGNTTQALPQYGIKDADVIIEAPVEGALTRLMAVYQNYVRAKLQTLLRRLGAGIRRHLRPLWTGKICQRNLKQRLCGQFKRNGGGCEQFDVSQRSKPQSASQFLYYRRKDPGSDSPERV